MGHQQESPSSRTECVLCRYYPPKTRCGRQAPSFPEGLCSQRTYFLPSSTLSIGQDFRRPPVVSWMGSLSLLLTTTVISRLGVTRFPHQPAVSVILRQLWLRALASLIGSYALDGAVKRPAFVWLSVAVSTLLSHRDLITRNRGQKLGADAQRTNRFIIIILCEPPPTLYRKLQSNYGVLRTPYSSYYCTLWSIKVDPSCTLQ
ncbi:hypothetical protein VTO42DRAFT_633 [Malbranchea cinnamomea]